MTLSQSSYNSNPLLLSSNATATTTTSPPNILPLVTPTNTSFTEYRGFYRNFSIAIKLDLLHSSPNAHASVFTKNSSHPIQIQISPLGKLQQNVYQVLADRVRFCRNITEIMTEVKDVLDRVLQSATVDKEWNATLQRHSQLPAKDTPSSLPQHTKGYYLWIRNELARIGWEHVATMDTRAERITLKTTDEKNRVHQVTLTHLIDWYAQMKSGVSISDSSANGAPRAVSKRSASIAPIQITHELPLTDDQFKIQLQRDSLNGRIGIVQQILQQFSQYVNQLQAFWDQMDDLDKNTWIIEPAHPNRSHKNRSISIGQHCSIRIEVDPLKPHLIPVCEFIGSDTIIQPLQQLWQKDAPTEWIYSGEKTLRQNMMHILKLDFPSPKEKDQDEEEHDIACGICYYTLSEAGEIPTVVCENVKCLKSYHYSCIMEWFQAQGAHTSFQNVNGECLYCNTKMTVRKKS